MEIKTNIAELAEAAWRLERWLNNLITDRKMAAKKSLRSIKAYLEAWNIEIVDPLGWKFDPGLSVEVINNEAPDADEDKLIIVQTNAPIIKQGGAVIQYGRVIIGTEIKVQKSIISLDKENRQGTEPTKNEAEKKFDEHKLENKSIEKIREKVHPRKFQGNDEFLVCSQNSSTDKIQLQNIESQKIKRVKVLRVVRLSQKKYRKKVRKAKRRSTKFNKYMC